jgi:hypothetical protein
VSDVLSGRRTVQDGGPCPEASVQAACRINLRTEDGMTEDERPPGMPRWVKVSIVVLGALVLVFVVLQLAGVGGSHGPGRHARATPQYAVPGVA